jgi:hypothetical protein
LLGWIVFPTFKRALPGSYILQLSLILLVDHQPSLSEKDFSGSKLPRQAKSSLETKSLRFCLIFIIRKTTSLGLKHPPNSRIMTWLVFITFLCMVSLSSCRASDNLHAHLKKQDFCIPAPRKIIDMINTYSSEKGNNSALLF